MSTSEFYTRFNQHADQLQHMAERSTPNRQEARRLYLETANRAMKQRMLSDNSIDFQHWIREIMVETLSELDAPVNSSF